ncbi:hypothetical protein SAMN05444714_1014 [Yoonia litorea]|uniref:Uncharacterized protein n=1 Tax=Yoonia litorea TaxID=1123755 RepID=A0A1I6LYM6_9RHOB|nr:hypothetical protein SAMN05444714_1014 [Yoonia litorea]
MRPCLEVAFALGVNRRHAAVLLMFCKHYGGDLWQELGAESIILCSIMPSDKDWVGSPNNRVFSPI